MSSPSPTPSVKTLKDEPEQQSRSSSAKSDIIDVEKALNLSKSPDRRNREDTTNSYAGFNLCLNKDSKLKREADAALDDLNKLKQLVLNSASEDQETAILKTPLSSRSNSTCSSIKSKFGPQFGDCFGDCDGAVGGIGIEGGTEPDAKAQDDAEFSIPDFAGRTNSLWDFCKVGNSNVKLSDDSLMLSNQQDILLSDLIYTLAGIRSDFITPLPRNADAVDSSKYETKFEVHEKMDKSLVNIVQEILPLSSYYMGIQKVIALTEDHSQVNNALNWALIDLTSDFYLLLDEAEMEHSAHRLTLHKMLYYMQPTIWIMKSIWTTVSKILVEKLKGAAVLTIFCKGIKNLEGDSSSQAALTDLVCKAAQPYMDMLSLWIGKGIISDIFDEFMIVDDKANQVEKPGEHSSDVYWERRYTIRSECIPSFLENYADIILRTGKYLNVVRECKKRRLPSQDIELKFDPKNEQQHVKVINEAYIFSARMLLDVLLNDNDLMGHLHSVNRYLLLNQGDFIMEFMDACENELAKNVDQILPMTLENLLGISLRLTSARNDKYKDNVHCELLTYDLVTQMSKIMKPKDVFWDNTDRLDLTGLECFAFNYVAKWPVSLVLNHTAISKYQMLFRQLFYCKHVERNLCKIWKKDSMVKRCSLNTAELYRPAFTLRQRMMNAIQNLEYYMMIETIEPNWHIFIGKMKQVENIDKVFIFHEDFLDACLKSCMLTAHPELNRAIFHLCKICTKFCDFIQQSQRVFFDAELKSMVRDSGDDNTDHTDSERPSTNLKTAESMMNHLDTFAERVKTFDLEFTGCLISFLRQVLELARANAGECFINLVHRINFNGYYSDQLE